MRAFFLRQYSKFLLLAVMLALAPGRRLAAQTLADDIQQLIMDYEKLAQEKQILTDMYKGYQLVYQGYEQVKGIASGNFHLHQGFLNALLEVLYNCSLIGKEFRQRRTSCGKSNW